MFRLINRLLFYPVTILVMALSIYWLIPATLWATAHIPIYKYILIGVGSYFGVGLLRIFNRNLEWAQTFSHELSHTLVGILFLRKIHSFTAEEGTGVMTHSGSWRFGSTLISLAPYSMPIFMYLLLGLRELGATGSLYIFDIMIGIACGFHLACFWKQTRPYQTDLQEVGFGRAYTFIFAAHTFNMVLLLRSVRYGTFKALRSIGEDYLTTTLEWWEWLSAMAIKCWLWLSAVAVDCWEWAMALAK